MTKNKLFLAYMWAESKDRLIEDHEILLVVAKNEEQAKQQLKTKSKLWSDIHIDAILEINNIDWYDIILQKWWEENIKKVSSYVKSSEF